MHYRSSEGIEVVVDSVEVDPDHVWHEVPGAVVTWPFEHTVTRLATWAIADIPSPSMGIDTLVGVDDDARLRLEAAIIEFGDFLSVTYQCRRIVRSPVPCVAIVPEGEGEAAELAQASGIRSPFKARPRGRLLPDIGEGVDVGAAVVDRLDGLALLADALSEDGAIGQLHNLFRVFERAFRKGPGDCAKLLLAFLKAGPVDLGWTDSEVNDWFLRLRPEATHADRREPFARAADAEPHLGRLEHAAYDVLLNKARWRSADSERRDLITLRAGVDADNETVRLQTPTAVLIAPWLDPFGVFPIDFNFRPEIGPPALTQMPGYTGHGPGEFITRGRFQRDDQSAEPLIYEITSWKGAATATPAPTNEPERKA